jgi:CRP-like cAMP-binding protein
MDDAFYQVVEGRAIATMHDPSGESRMLDIIGPGEVFGEIPFLLGLISNVTIEAQPGTVISVISRTDLENLIQTNATFAPAFYKFLAKTIFSRLVKLYQGEDLARCKSLAAPLPTETRKGSFRAPMPRSPISVRREQRMTVSTTDPSGRPRESSGLVTNSSSPSFSNFLVVPNEGRARATSFADLPEVIDSSEVSPSRRKISPRPPGSLQ